jgi:High potential iron-sulfur protein
MSNRQQQDRRGFLRLGTIAVVASAIPGLATAQARVAESDPQAAALGYREDTTKVDKAKFPKHDASQKCSGCQLFQGKAGEAAGPCSIFPGKVVAANGWCSAFNKKA